LNPFFFHNNHLLKITFFHFTTKKVKKLSWWAKLFLFCFFSFIFLVVSLLIAINIPSVKDKLAKEAIGFLNKEFKTTFSAENVEINFLGDVVINGVSAKDHHDFEFLKAKKLIWADCSLIRITKLMVCYLVEDKLLDLWITLNSMAIFHPMPYQLMGNY